MANCTADCGSKCAGKNGCGWNACTTSCGGERNSCGVWNNGCTCSGSCMNDCTEGACGSGCDVSCHITCLNKCIDSCITYCDSVCKTKCHSSSCSATGREEKINADFHQRLYCYKLTYKEWIIA